MVEEAFDVWWRSCRQGCNMAVDCGGCIDVSVQINCTSSHRCLSHGLGFNEMVCHWVSHRVGQGATGQDVLASKEM